MDYVGKKISLISQASVRYVGVLESIDENTATISLRDVRSHGTEGRKDNPLEEIPGSETVYPLIAFKGSDVKDLQVEPKASRSPPPGTAPVNGQPAPQPNRQPPPPFNNGPGSQLLPYGHHYMPTPHAGYGHYPYMPHPQHGPHGGPSPGPRPGPGSAPGSAFAQFYGGPPGWNGPPPVRHGFPPHMASPYGGHYPMNGYGGPPGQGPTSNGSGDYHQQQPMPPGPAGKPFDQAAQLQGPHKSQIPDPFANSSLASATDQPPTVSSLDGAARQTSTVRLPGAKNTAAPRATELPTPLPDVPSGPKSIGAEIEPKQKAATVTAPTTILKRDAPQSAQQNKQPSKTPTPISKGPTTPAVPSMPRPHTNASQASVTERVPHTNNATHMGRVVANAQQKTAQEQAVAAVQAAMSKLPAAQAQNGSSDAYSVAINRQMGGLAVSNGHEYPSYVNRIGSRDNARGGTTTGYRGRGGRGSRQTFHKMEIPKDDYDFEKANAKFNKQDLVKEAIASGSPVTEAAPAQPLTPLGANLDTDARKSSVSSASTKDKESAFEIPAAPYVKSSFFDNISSDLRDRHELDEAAARQQGRERRGEETKRNFETFGQGSVDGARGRGRGGYRGRGRGGGRGIGGGDYRGMGHRGGAGMGTSRGRGGPRKVSATGQPAVAPAA